MRTISPGSRFLFSPQLSASGVPENAATFSRRRHTHARVQSLHPHTDTQKHTHTHTSPLSACGPQKGMNIHYSQALVTAKLLATSKLSMWGVSLNSEVEN